SGGLINPSGLGSKDSKRGSGFLYSLHQAGKTAAHAVTLAAGGTLLASGAGIVTLPFALPFVPAVAIGAGATILGSNSIAGISALVKTASSRKLQEEATLKKQQEAKDLVIANKRQQQDKATLQEWYTPVSPAGNKPFEFWVNKQTVNAAIEATGEFLEVRDGKNGSRPHLGKDYSAPRGAATVANEKARVVFAGYYASGVSEKDEQDLEALKQRYPNHVDIQALTSQEYADIRKGTGNTVMTVPDGSLTTMRVQQHFGDKQVFMDSEGKAPLTEGGNLLGKDTPGSGINVKAGDVIIPGMIIGTVGNTGKILPREEALVRGQETGTHLHYAVMEVDPKKNPRMKALKEGTADASLCSVGKEKCSTEKQNGLYKKIRKEFFNSLGHDYDLKADKPVFKFNPVKSHDIRNLFGKALGGDRDDFNYYGAVFTDPDESLGASGGRTSR
ncbi:MAG: M23 family metallopeptidase, partial [Elusimicrobiota bacterium]